MEIQDSKYKNKVNIKAHIWPPNSTSPNYKLPGGSNSRQGFYFYRNNRLVQGGGWNGSRENEPHNSLARLEIDIDSSIDIDISLDVKKVEINLPSDLMDSITSSKTKTNIDFKKYISLANEAYRKRKLFNSELPLIPTAGLPGKLVKYLHKELKLKNNHKYRALKFIWKKMDEDIFFDIDNDGESLVINSVYRKKLHHGLDGTSADMPVLKCLLYFALEEALDSERVSQKMKDKLDKINNILIRAVKLERE